LIWFHGWTPTHWVLIADVKGVRARCTWASARCVYENRPKVHDEILMSIDAVGKIEKAVPGSIPGMMGFDFLICDGEPGSAVLNRPLSFAPRVAECATAPAILLHSHAHKPANTNQNSPAVLERCERSPSTL
jgi:hypothetical protein